MDFINKAFADDIVPVTESETVIVEETPVTPQNTLISLLPFVVIFMIFYFFIIRPQIRQQKQHKNMLAQLKRGDKVITNSGILGTIVKVEDGEYIQVEIAQNTKVRMLKTSVAQTTNVTSNVEVIDEKKTNKKLENKTEAKIEEIQETDK